MKKFSYKKVAKQIGWNFSDVKITVEHPSGYNYYQAVVEAIKFNETKMLDIGCGSGEKSVMFFSGAKEITMIDVEPDMIEKARANLERVHFSKEKRNKFKICLGDCEKPLPFDDESFDLVVSRHCGANMAEVFRVLKKGGKFISEDYATNDCQELKDYFGRGQGYGESPLQNKIVAKCLDVGFAKVQCLQFEEIEYYETEKDLKFLLGMTPILGGYDDEKDNSILQKYIEKFGTEKGIRLNRHLFSLWLEK